MTTLVTGGLGYLGSRLLRELAARPAVVDGPIRVLDNLQRPRHHVLWGLPDAGDYDDDYEFVRGDVRDEEVVSEAMTGVDAVVHLAAITNAARSTEIPEETRTVNRDGALTVFEAAREAGVEEFVYASTCSVYGTTEGVVDETADTAPESPYAEAKRAAERAILDRGEEADPTVTALRFGTVHGWSAGMRFDTIPTEFAFAAATGQRVQVYEFEGLDERYRPLVHVGDAARAMGFALADLDGGVYNVVGENATVAEIARTVADVAPDASVERVRVADGAARSCRVDGGKLAGAGFEMESGLADGIAEVVERFEGIQ
ncbi:MAG: UDP-glucose 4-epimerase [Natronomonas sp.]|jgi:UDP-glucose 4-epimerase